jgi:hypothetical protein
MFIVVSSLLQQIEKVAAVKGPSIALVDDLVAVVRKHDLSREVTAVKAENVAR